MELLIDDPPVEGRTKRILKFCTPTKWHKNYTKEFFVAWFAAWNISSVCTIFQMTIGKKLWAWFVTKVVPALVAVKTTAKNVFDSVIDAIFLGT